MKLYNKLFVYYKKNVAFIILSFLILYSLLRTELVIFSFFVLKGRRKATHFSLKVSIFTIVAEKKEKKNKERERKKERVYK
jgi:hypothetical protein